jgi:hypothetical protein
MGPIGVMIRPAPIQSARDHHLYGYDGEAAEPDQEKRRALPLETRPGNQKQLATDALGSRKVSRCKAQAVLSRPNHGLSVSVRT